MEGWVGGVCIATHPSDKQEEPSGLAGARQPLLVAGECLVAAVLRDLFDHPDEVRWVNLVSEPSPIGELDGPFEHLASIGRQLFRRVAFTPLVVGVVDMIHQSIVLVALLAERPSIVQTLRGVPKYHHHDMCRVDLLVVRLLRYSECGVDDPLYETIGPTHELVEELTLSPGHFLSVSLVSGRVLQVGRFNHPYLLALRNELA